VTRSGATLLALGIAALSLSGCGSPNQANIQLRKDNQQLSAQIDQLNRQHTADTATIQALQATNAVQTLPQSRLNELYTVAGLRLGKLTGGFHPDPNAVGDTMLKVYVVPTDQDGDPIKAAGTFKIELFDLALAKDNRIGQWDFDLQQTHANWYSQLFMYTYVLSCPWQTQPIHSNLLARVTFTDALTGRVLTVDRDINVQLPPKS
jgi:outer membrane murein-binding lipoprotein Lpp